MGDDDATAASEAKVVMDIETMLAKASTKREDLRNPEANYHKLTLVQLADLTPHLSWADYFKEVGAPDVSSADIAQTDFFKAVDAALVSVPLDQWKIYLRWHVDSRCRAGPAQEIRRREFRFLRPATDRREADSASLAALRAADRR